MVICVGTDRYEMPEILGIRWRMCHKRESIDSLVLGKPNKKQRNFQNHSYTLSMHVDTFNIRYVM